MSPLEKLKSEAAALEAKARGSGHPLKHSAALEQVARAHGYKNWRACLAVLTKVAPGSSPTPSSEPQLNEVEMKRYKSSEWNFGLDIPTRWNAFPGVPTNSPYEVIRFASHEDGVHLLIIFRAPYDPQKSPRAYSEQIQQILVKKEFSNFVTAETAIGSRVVLTLDFDKPMDNGTWSCRHYFVFNGTLAYTLGFGTNKRDAMIDLYERMAKSFFVEEWPSSSASQSL